MSQEPNPSLDCASLVRFFAPPLYHGGELQSCWAAIRSSSLSQTSLSLWTIKTLFIFFSPVFTSTPHRICLVRERERQAGTFRAPEKMGETRGRKKKRNCGEIASLAGKRLRKWLNVDLSELVCIDRRCAAFQESFWSLFSTDVYLYPYWGHIL